MTQSPETLTKVPLKQLNIDFSSAIPGCFMFFYDKKDKTKPDETGFNKIGVFIDNETIIYYSNGMLRTVSIDKLKKHTEKINIMIPDKNFDYDGVVAYFKNNSYNINLFNLGLFAADKNIPEILHSGQMIPTKFIDYSTEDYERAWSTLYSKIEPCDLIFVRNRNSIVSKFIAKIDNGFWSHVATYMGFNYIHDTCPPQTRIRSLAYYKKNKFSIGVYRPIGITSLQKAEMLAFLVKNTGKGYNYFGAIILGIRLLLHLKTPIPSPNGLIFRGGLYPIFFI